MYGLLYLYGADKIKKKTLFSVIIFLAVIFVGSINLFEQSHSVNKIEQVIKSQYPIPPGEHPRLFIRSKDIPDLKRKATSPELQLAMQKLIFDSQLNSDGNLHEIVNSKDSNYSEEIRRSIEANALLYVIRGDSEHGQKAVSMMKNFMSTLVFPENNYYTSTKSGQVITTGAMVYDWCYSLLTSEEKSEMISKFEHLAKYLEVGYPPKIFSSITSHASGQLIMRDLLCAGIAIYDEKKEIYDTVSKIIMEKYIPPRDFIYQSGMHYQGDSYGPGRSQWEILSNFIFLRMGYKDVFSKQQGQMPYRWIYTRRPDGQLLRDGDNYLSSDRLGNYWRIPEVFLYSSGYYKDPVLKGEFVRQYFEEGGEVDPVAFILFSDVDIPIKPVYNLPLTKYFGNPVGTMVARTGWDTGIDSTSVVAEMKIGVYNFNNHCHLDAGKFQIYYKGALAIDSGLYEGQKGGYGSEHDINYNKRSIAHNTMLVYDPNEEMKLWNKPVSNDGGQIFPNNGNEPKDFEDLLKNGYKVSEVLGQEFGPDKLQPEYTYLKGDLTKAYSTKVEKYQRSFAFLNLKNSTYPAALIVFDRVIAANKDNKKYWLLHSIEEPEINGTVTTIKRTEKGYTGKLINYSLLPDRNNINIEKVGGQGKEFWVFDRNYPQVPYTKETCDESGAWRIQISPNTPEKQDYFLNAMIVTDNKEGTNTPVPLKVENDKLVGVKVLDRVVLFSKSGEKINNSVKVNIFGNGEKLKYLLADMEKGFWKIERPGKPVINQIEVTKEGGVLYFEGDTGEYIITRFDTRTVPQVKTPTNPLVEKNDRIRIDLNGQLLYFDVPPTLINNRTMVPFRTIFEALGAIVKWDEANKTVTAYKKDLKVVLKIDNTNALVNGTEKTLDVPATIIDDRTMVPVRFIAESLGTRVDWDDKTRTVIITTLPVAR